MAQRVPCLKEQQRGQQRREEERRQPPRGVEIETHREERAQREPNVQDIGTINPVLLELTKLIRQVNKPRQIQRKCRTRGESRAPKLAPFAQQERKQPERGKVEGCELLGVHASRGKQREASPVAPPVSRPRAPVEPRRQDEQQRQ